MSYRDPEQARAYSRAKYQKTRSLTLVRMSEQYSADKDFYKLKSRGNHLRQYFKGCNWREALACYDVLFEQQKGVCAICDEPETKIDRQRNTVCKLAVDHSYLTGKVKGLLCFRCNTNLGRFEKYFRKIMRYLVCSIVNN